MAVATNSGFRSTQIDRATVRLALTGIKTQIVSCPLKTPFIEVTPVITFSTQTPLSIHPSATTAWGQFARTKNSGPGPSAPQQFRALARDRAYLSTFYAMCASSLERLISVTTNLREKERQLIGKQIVLLVAIGPRPVTRIEVDA